MRKGPYQRFTVKLITNCARCGLNHSDLAFEKFLAPHDKWTHFADCPEVHQPIFMQVTPDAVVEEEPTVPKVIGRVRGVGAVGINSEGKVVPAEPIMKRYEVLERDTDHVLALVEAISSKVALERAMEYWGPNIKVREEQAVPPLNPQQHVELPTGAKRSNVYPPGTKFPARYDLLFRNASGLRRLAETWGEGEAKYGPDNWTKGFPESVYISHALEHIRLYLAGDTTDDHLSHATWNLMGLMWTQDNKPELLDLTKLTQVV